MDKQWYLFDVNPSTPPAFEVASGEAFTLEVRGAFADVKDIRTVPTPFTPAGDGHPLAPIAGPVRVRGAKPGDAIVVELLEITPHGEGKTAILRDFGVLRREFGEPWALSCPVKDGRAWFGGRIPIALNPNLGTVSTMPTEGYKPAYAGPYGGDFDQKDVRAGSRVHLPVMVDGARGAVEWFVGRTGMDRREAYMLLSIVGELRIGTSPRPVMAARLIIPRYVIDAAAGA